MVSCNVEHERATHVDPAELVREDRFVTIAATCLSLLCRTRATVHTSRGSDLSSSESE